MTTCKLLCSYSVPPTITNPPAEDLEGIEGHELSIVCTGDGKPKPKYVFFKVIHLNMIIFVIYIDERANSCKQKTVEYTVFYTISSYIF